MINEQSWFLSNKNARKFKNLRAYRAILLSSSLSLFTSWPLTNRKMRVWQHWLSSWWWEKNYWEIILTPYLFQFFRKIFAWKNFLLTKEISWKLRVEHFDNFEAKSWRQITKFQCQNRQKMKRRDLKLLLFLILEFCKEFITKKLKKFRFLSARLT